MVFINVFLLKSTSTGHFILAWRICQDIQLVSRSVDALAVGYIPYRHLYPLPPAVPSVLLLDHLAAGRQPEAAKKFRVIPLQPQTISLHL